MYIIYNAYIELGIIDQFKKNIKSCKTKTCKQKRIQDYCLKV